MLSATRFQPSAPQSARSVLPRTARFPLRELFDFLNRKPVRPSREIYRQFTSRSPNLGSNCFLCCVVILNTRGYSQPVFDYVVAERLVRFRLHGQRQHARRCFHNCPQVAFCQVEAAETAIWVTEVLRNRPGASVCLIIWPRRTKTRQPGTQNASSSPRADAKLYLPRCLFFPPSAAASPRVPPVLRLGATDFSLLPNPPLRTGEQPWSALEARPRRASSPRCVLDHQTRG